tara:strand:- start:621 stop:917 length:297 start_codon:yes stop_codon:yes gene_type:complete
MAARGYISQRSLDKAIKSDFKSVIFEIQDAIGCLMEGKDMPEYYCDSLPDLVAHYQVLSGGALPTKFLDDLKAAGYHELLRSIYKGLAETLAPAPMAA